MSSPIATGFHIAVYVPARTSGGGLVFYRELVAALVGLSSGPRVSVLTPADSTMTSWPAGSEVRTLPSASRFSRLPWSASERALRHAVTEAGPDVLLSAGSHAPAVRNCPVVFWPLTVAPFEPETVQILSRSLRDRLRWKLIGASARWSASRADALIFSSAYARSRYVTTARLKKKRARTILPAVSLSELDHVDRTHLQDFLFVSHIYPYKMIDRLLVAFDQAVAQGPISGDLLIAGNVPDSRHRAHIARVHANLEHPGRIKFLGACDADELRGLYRTARVFVFPSISENAGSYALIDAFAAGVPTLSSSRSSMPEICGTGAMLFDPDDIPALTQMIRLLASDQDVVASASNRALENYKRFPTWPQLACETLSFLQEVTRPEADQ